MTARRTKRDKEKASAGGGAAKAPRTGSSSTAKADPRKRSRARSTPQPAVVANPSELPQDGKLYYRIGEVSQITGVKPYVLRYWESEFSWIRPEKTSSKQRRYRRQDVALLLQIKRLRYDEQLTIARTRQFIRDSRSQGGRQRKPHRQRADCSSPVQEPRRFTEASSAEFLRKLAKMRQEVVELLRAAEE